MPARVPQGTAPDNAINDWLVENKAWFTPEAAAARAAVTAAEGPEKVAPPKAAAPPKPQAVTPKAAPKAEPPAPKPAATPAPAPTPKKYDAYDVR